jgi:hypothetical protein
MNIKYIGLDVHKETISIAVMNGDGKLVIESIIETKAITILQFIQGLSPLAAKPRRPRPSPRSSARTVL